MPAFDGSPLCMIKCSTCGMEIEISAMGEHICAQSPSDTQPTPAFAIAPAPLHSLPSGRDSPALLHEPASPFSAPLPKVGRQGPPPRIDPSVANRPFLRPDTDSPSSEHGFRSRSPVAGSSRSRSLFRTLERSQTSPLPAQPPSPKLSNLDCAFPPFPTARARSATRSGKTNPLLDPNLVKTATPSPRPPTRSSTDTDQRPAQSWENVETPRGLVSATLVKPEESLAEPLHGTTPMHQRESSIDSKSSYRTSLASTRNGEPISRPSTSHSIRRPSLANASRPQNVLFDAPPMPAAPVRPPTRSSTHSRDSATSQYSSRPGGNSESFGGFNFGISTESTNVGGKSSGSPQSSPSLLQPLPSYMHASTGHGVSGDGQTSPGTPQYKAFNPSATLGPARLDSDAPGDPNSGLRKNSDAGSVSGLSVSNFARALNLTTGDNMGNSSVSSSDTSPSETRSGSSMSSVPSEPDSSRPRPLNSAATEENQESKAAETFLTQEALTESPVELKSPRIPAALLSPDSPTDPAIMMHLTLGSLSLRTVQDISSQSISMRQPTTPSETAAQTPRAKARIKGCCRGCGEAIMGKSVSSADGRLTGRYHKACFVCNDCRAPFQTADFYVLDDRPYCGQHYHERNGSLCASCNTGIEGQYLETNESTRSNGRAKFHPDCLRCYTCRIVLNGEYFEWNGQVYCERDARRAASVPPNARPRPTAPSSPLGQPRGYPPRYPPGGPGLRPGPGPGGPAAAYGPFGGARRFPERRTTRLMMG